MVIRFEDGSRASFKTVCGLKVIEKGKSHRICIGCHVIIQLKKKVDKSLILLDDLSSSIILGPVYRMVLAALQRKFLYPLWCY
jgi:hypothetical protein